jgi:hypothetical protein
MVGSSYQPTAHSYRTVCNGIGVLGAYTGVAAISVDAVLAVGSVGFLAALESSQAVLGRDRYFGDIQMV